MTVGRPPSHTVHNAAGSVRGRRIQYGLRHHIGCTIHAIMGQTVESLITRVESGDKRHPYALWLASQVVVLLSRTRLGSQTYFWLTKNAKSVQQPSQIVSVQHSYAEITFQRLSDQVAERSLQYKWCLHWIFDQPRYSPVPTTRCPYSK